MDALNIENRKIYLKYELRRKLEISLAIPLIILVALVKRKTGQDYFKSVNICWETLHE